MRVLFCIDSLHHGGTERQLVKLIDGIDRTRITPFLCTLKPSSIDLAALGCPVVELGFTSLASPRFPRQLMQLRRFIRTHRIEIIQTYFQDPTIVAYLASRRTGIKRIFGAFRDLGFWRTRMKSMQLRAVFPRFDGFIANSRSVAETFSRADGIPPEKIAVIYNGVDVPPVRYETEFAAGDAATTTATVGIVANLNRPVKRVDLFVDAAAIVGRERPDARFLIVGDGHLRESLERRAVGHGIGGAVSFVGRQPLAGEFTRRFDVGVICSDSEGFSNAVLEYMSHGVPPVATAVGGNTELIDDGETGLLVPPGSAELLAQAIVRLLADSGLRRRLGKRARELVASRYTVERCVREHEEHYIRSLAGERNLSAPLPVSAGGTVAPGDR